MNVDQIFEEYQDEGNGSKLLLEDDILLVEYKQIKKMELQDISDIISNYFETIKPYVEQDRFNEMRRMSNLIYKVHRLPPAVAKTSSFI